MNLKYMIILVALLVAALSASCAGAQDLDLVRQRFPLGADLGTVMDAADTHCADTEINRYSAAQAEPYGSQVQVNCLGYDLFGETRTIEFLVNDGALGFYWILVDRDELPMLHAFLDDNAGTALCDTGLDIIFPGEQSALRSEPPEILISQRDDLRAITGGCP